MKKFPQILAATLIISYAGASIAADTKVAPHWEYKGEEGAENWGKLDESFHQCEVGYAQSPIDIKETVEADLPDIGFSYAKFAPSIVNNGHTIQVNVPAGQSITIGKDSYQLVQFHFHTPSEYHINSKTYPLEIHFVHKNAEGKLAVIGVMVEEGVANGELAKIFVNAPKKAGEEKKADTAQIDPASLLPTDKKYYRFMGSLTTPPCSEGVNWEEMESPITASKKQITTFKAFYANNARPLQPANQRLIVKDNK